MEEKLAAAVVSLISGFLGAWLASAIALSRFRKERAFDRQLDWYEKMVRALYDMAQRIEIALTFQGEPQTEIDHLRNVWRDVQKAHLALEKLSQEAALYGSDDARQKAKAIIKKVQDVADETGAFDPPSVDDKTIDDVVTRIEKLPEHLRKAAEPIATEARKHLGMS